MPNRKTIDVWYIFVDYGQGMPDKPADAECTEFGRYQFLVNKLAYEQNCGYPINTRRGRMKKTDLPGEWDESKNRLAEAKAEVDYFKTVIRLRGTSEQRERKLKFAEQKLEQLLAPAS